MSKKAFHKIPYREAITLECEDKYCTLSELALLMGKRRRTIQAYHPIGLRYHKRTSRINEYHARASMHWINGHEMAKNISLALSAVEPLALNLFLHSFAVAAPLTICSCPSWMEKAIHLGGRMGYDKSVCILACGTIQGLYLAANSGAESHAGLILMDS